MTSIYNCDQSELVEKAGEELKKVQHVKAPVWAAFVKTGMHKQRPPAENDWWHIRAASVLRQIYKKGPIGVSKLRTSYGGKKDRGYKTEHFYKGSGSIIRKVLQQLESAGFVKKEEKSVHKGRVITAEGKKFLDNIASKISVVIIKPQQRKEEKAEEPKSEIREQDKKAKVPSEGKKKQAKEAKQEQKAPENKNG